MSVMSRIQFNLMSERIKFLSIELDYQNSRPYQDLALVSEIDMELDKILNTLSIAKKAAEIKESGLELIHS